MDDQCNRKPREAQFKLTKKGAKRAANRAGPLAQKRPQRPIKDLPEATTQGGFLNIKQADGVATTGEFSSPAATYWWVFEVG